jgi:hypothetical protein
LARGLLFAGTGVAWFTFWYFTDPRTETIAEMQVWPRVIWFSAMLLLLAVALLTFGRMVGGRSSTRFATVAAATAGVMSVTNIVEDGFRVETMFLVFVAGLWILTLTLAGLTVTIARAEVGRRRLLAVIPAASLLGILLFPPAGGPIMLGAWLAAAAASLAPFARRLIGDPTPRTAAAP